MPALKSDGSLHVSCIMYAYGVSCVRVRVRVMPCPKCAATAAGAVLVFGAADDHQIADVNVAVDGAGDAAPGSSTGSQPGLPHEGAGAPP